MFFIADFHSGQFLFQTGDHKLGFVLTGSQEEEGYGYGSYKAYEAPQAAKERVS